MCFAFFLCHECKKHLIIPFKKSSRSRGQPDCSVLGTMVMCGDCISKRSMSSLTISSLQQGYRDDLAIIEEVLGKEVVFKFTGHYSVSTGEVDSSSTTPLFPMPFFPREFFRLEDSKIVDFGAKILVRPSKYQVDAFLGLDKHDSVVFVVTDQGSGPSLCDNNL
jgi:hypothetical protein